MSEHYDLFVLGAGVAGMTAAEEAARRGLRVALAEEGMFGGLVTNVNHLQPGPEGMPESGADLAADLMTKAADAGVETLMSPVESLSLLPSGEVEVATPDGRYHARCAIVATGARLRKLNVPGEEEFEHRGVSHCADCDGPLFKGQTVVVVGSGDSALQEAVVLAQFCGAVHVVHRGRAFSGREAFVRNVVGDPRITVHFGTVVEAIEGQGDVEAVTLRSVQSGATSRLPCTGFFAYVGLEANTGFLDPGVGMEAGCIAVNGDLETTLPNVYAIGAVRAGYGGEVVHAIADARKAVSGVCERLVRA